MAPVHDWKDDAEFLRYNKPEPYRCWGDRPAYCIIAIGTALILWQMLFG